MNGNGLQASNADQLQRLTTLYGNQPGYQAFSDKLNAYNTALNNYNNLLASKGFNGGRMGDAFWNSPDVMKASHDIMALRNDTLNSIPQFARNDPSQMLGQQFSGIVTQPETSDKKGHGFLGGIFQSPALQPALDVVAAGTGNPELIPLINAATTYGSTGNLGKAALSGAEAFGGTEAAGALANAYPDLGLPGGSAGNSLTDALGMTQGAGSLTGPGTIGGDLSSLTSGIKGAFGPSSVGGGSSGGGFNLSTAGESSALPSGLTDNAAAPDVTKGFNYDLNGNPSATTEGFGTGAAPATGISGLFTPPNTPSTGGFNYDLNGNPAGLSSYSAPEMFSAAAPTDTSGGFKMPGLSSLFNNNNIVNGVAKAGLAGLLNNNNNKGYNAQMNAGNQIQQDFMPFLNNGTQASNTLAALFGMNGPDAMKAAQTDWQNTPGYQFALDQGMKAVNADAAAKGQLLSGNNQQAIQKFGTGLADQTYNNYLQNLINQATQGQQAAQGVASGQIGVANAQAGKSGNAANAQNMMTGGMLSSLFPSQSLFDPSSQSGLLSYLFNG